MKPWSGRIGGQRSMVASSGTLPSPALMCFLISSRVSYLDESTVPLMDMLGTISSKRRTRSISGNTLRSWNAAITPAPVMS
jgi:hypothetical protein